MAEDAVKRCSELNLVEIQENEGLQSSEFMINHAQSPKSAHKALRHMGSREKARALSSLPRNAVNIYTMKKGLYLKSGRVN